ncbi:MAG: RNA pyrophosphohydrolase [Anaplasmataceae bacterium]|nr:RNA pyrophosphohydrolase [Candidatus Heimdallarchaeota archaeon]MDH5796094.1 RNA pyrophosphohydrolase [Anaplasmataceae bacterium]
MQLGLYRNGVGAVIINDQRHILTGEKMGALGFWQLPQGGVRHRESYEEALYRELEEEIGTNRVVIVKNTSKMMSYLLPKDPVSIAQIGGNNNYIGQRQLWFLCRFIGDLDDINITTQCQEFCSYRWNKLDDIVKSAPDFKKELYSNLLQEFSDYL